MVGDNETVAAFFGTLEAWNQVDEAMDEIGRILNRSRRRSAVGALSRCCGGPVGALGVGGCGGGGDGSILFT